MEMLSTAAKLHWIFLVRYVCFRSQERKWNLFNDSSSRQKSHPSPMLSSVPKGAHTLGIATSFFSSSELLTSYIQVQLKVQLIQKVWTQWHAVSSENVNQFFQRKSVCCCEGSRVTLMPKAMKIVFLGKIMFQGCYLRRNALFQF